MTIENVEIVRRDGKVALRQIGRTNMPVPIEVDGVVYQASPQHNVWIAWVDESATEFLLSKQIQGCNCDNGAMKPLYKLASILDVSIFDTGDRPQ